MRQEEVSDEEDAYVIRNLAYELWEKAGRPPGKHLDFWQQATRRLRQGVTTQDLPASTGRQVDEASTATPACHENGNATG